MSDFVEILVDMGFDPEKSKKALEATGNRGIEQAMDWILKNPDPIGKDSEVNEHEGKEISGENEVAEKTESSGGEAAVRSYKCDECGKILKDATEMEYHAAKTKHSQFSESTDEKKPLTAEEKAAQLKRIEEKLKEKRAERELKEKEEAIAREKSRIKHGKEIIEAKRRIEEQQMKEIADARRREKIEDKQARDRVRAQIEADKLARKTKQDAEMGIAIPTATVSTSSSTETKITSPKKDYSEAKIQLRLPNGKQMVQTFGANEPLAAVRLYVEMNRDDGLSGPFNLMSNVPPRKIYQGDDYEIPLQALGLVPSAVLMVTKST